MGTTGYHSEALDALRLWEETPEEGGGDAHLQRAQVYATLHVAEKVRELTDLVKIQLRRRPGGGW